MRRRHAAEPRGVLEQLGFRDALSCYQLTGVLLGDKDAVGKVRLLLTDSSRIWVESNALRVSACDLRWPRFPANQQARLYCRLWGKNAPGWDP